MFSTYLNPGCYHHVELFPDPSHGGARCHVCTQRRERTGQRQRGDPHGVPLTAPGFEAVMVQGEKETQMCAARPALFGIQCIQGLSEAGLSCFYGLCLHTQVELLPAGSTAVLEAGTEEEKTSSLFTSDLQSLEMHSSQPNTKMCVCVFVYTWPSCLNLCRLSSYPPL